jgi:hypothetical protein
VYKIRQVLMAQAVGADYVAPYLGRIADGIAKSYMAPGSSISEEDQQEIKQTAMESALDAVAAMQAGVTATGSQMRVLVASIRDASDMSTLAARVSGRCCGRGQDKAGQGRRVLWMAGIACQNMHRPFLQDYQHTVPAAQSA